MKQNVGHIVESCHMQGDLVQDTFISPSSETKWFSIKEDTQGVHNI